MILDGSESFSIVNIMEDTLTIIATNFEYDTYYEPTPWIYVKSDGTFIRLTESEMQRFAIYISDFQMMLYTYTKEEILGGVPRHGFLNTEELNVLMNYAKAAATSLTNVRNKDLLTIWKDLRLGIDPPV